MVDLVSAGLLLVVLGFGVVVVSMLRRPSDDGAKVKGAGVVMIGPIPLIFGSDAKWASVAIALAVVLMLLALLAGFV